MLNRVRALGLPSWAGSSALTIAIAVTYFLAARLSLALLTEPDGVAVFWPAAGIASGIMIALGPVVRLPVAVGVMAATITANLLGDRNIGSAIVFALCNAGESMLIAWLIEYHFGSRFSLDSSRRVLGLFLATAVGTAISGIGGTAGFILFHSSDAPFLSTWLNWVASDAIGVVTVAPLVIGLARTLHDLPEMSELAEGMLALVVLALVSAIGFGSPTDYWFTILPLALLFPLLLWPAAHCRPVFAAAAAFIIALAIVWTITFGIGRLGDPSLRLADRVHAAEAALLAITACALALAALFSERRRNEAALKDSNHRLQLALDCAELGTWSLHLKTDRFENDVRDRHIHGHVPEAPPQSLAQMRSQVHPDDLSNLDGAFAGLRRPGGSCRTEYRLIPRTDQERAGRERWVAFEGAVVRDTAGRPVQLLGVTRDITERKHAEARLQESERVLRDLLGALPAAIYVTDAVGRITYCNEGAVKLWGARPKLGEDRWSDFSRYYHVDGTPMATEDCPTEVALKQGRTVSNLEAILERPDGTRIPIMPYPTPLHDGTGAIIGVVNMTVDISERKKAERSLADRTMQLALAGKVARVGSYSYDIGTDVMQVSEGYAVVHGLAEGTEKTTRSQWRARIHPEDLIRVEEVRKQAFRVRRAEYDIEYRIVRSGGEVRWIESRSFMLYNNDGAPQRVIGVNIDITERKRAEQALAERKTQLEVANNIAQVGSYTYNYATRMAWLGPGSASIYGLHENCVEMSSDEWRQYVHPDDLGQLVAEACQALANRQRELVCVFRILRHGEVRWIETRNRYFYDNAGRATQAIGATIDVTERRRAEDHKGRLVAELDHRVKNMLATVSVVASQTRDTSRSMEDFVTGLNGRIRSMASAHELLSIRRWQGLPLAELVQRELAPYATSNNTEIDGPEVMLSADVGQAMAMVVHELVTNAAKYGALSTQCGRVSVRWSQMLNGSAGQRFVLEWQETGGPRVEAPKESGYGISAIRELIPYEYGGTVDFALPPEGVRCRFEIPAAWLGGGNHQSNRLNGSSSTQPSPA